MILSLFPAAFWLWYLAGVGPPRKRPWSVYALAFGAGVLSPWPVLALGGPGLPSGWLAMLAYFVLAVGLVEEGAKLLAARLTVYYHRAFRDSLDGLVLSGCIALGFATTENVVYVERFGESVLLGRAILSTFGHVLMSSFWGLALGRRRGLLAALGVAALVHGLYDWLLVMGQPLLAVLFLGVLWHLFRQRVVESVLADEHRPRVSRRRFECGACRTLVREEARFCTNCGQSTPANPVLVCGNCLTPVAGTAVCAGCGCRFIGAAARSGSRPS